jgi:hypothetical protein
MQEFRIQIQTKTLCITNSHEVVSDGDIIQLEDQFI